MTLEEEKLSIEKEKLELDRKRLKYDFWRTVLASVAIISLVVPIINYTTSIKAANIKAKSDFKLKVIEVILDSKKSTDIRSKAIILQELFPDDLPSDFSDKIIKILPIDNDKKS